MKVQFFTPRPFQVQQVAINEENGTALIQPFPGKEKSFALVGHVVVEDDQGEHKAYDLKVQTGTGDLRLMPLSGRKRK